MTAKVALLEGGEDVLGRHEPNASSQGSASLLPFPDESAILNSMVQYSPTVDRAFSALADPTRRAVLERLGAGSATICLLSVPFGLSLSGRKMPIQLLEAAQYAHS